MTNANSRTRALIVGGTQGLGHAIAARLIEEGCTALAISGRDESKGQAAAETLSRSGASVIFIRADIARTEDCLRLVEDAEARLGPLNGLVNAAAACDRGSLLDTTPEIFDHLMATNARGPFFTMQAFARKAKERRAAASMVNIVSMVVHCGQSYLAPYSASKVALANITRNAAQALRSDRIRCNAIACGWMDTPGEAATQRKYHGAGDDWLEKAEAAQPFGQLVRPDEVAPLATYLISPASGVMTGAVIDCDQNVAGAYPE
jgi:NAD(P)-dependent dehydrogenase (short-subunit alcohol dehydrogenase family)